jgi:hypothetical protein
VSRARKRASRSAGGSTRGFVLVLALLLLGSFARTGRGAQAAVDATFDAQIYQVGTAYGDPMLGRRRYVETLSLRVTDLTSRVDTKSPALDAVVRVRLDGDLGQDPAERDPGRPDRFVPGLAEAPFDLMMAYVEGRNFAHGAVGFRLGRQYVVDPLGFWSFDGALVRLSTPAFIGVEAYGGFEQRGGLSMLSTSRFEADGIFRGDRSGLGSAFWPAYLSETKLAPAYGFTLLTQGLGFLDAKLTYRKVENRDTVVAVPFSDARGDFELTSGARTSTERFGAAASALADGLGSLRGDLVYDLYSRRVSSYSASADYAPRAPFGAGVDFAYFLPTFDADSIFNWFSSMGTTTVAGRLRFEPVRRIAIAGSFGVRRFAAEGEGSLLDVLGSIDATYKRPDLVTQLRLMDEHGQRGLRRGGDVSLRRLFAGGLYDASTRLSLYDWNDTLRPIASTTSLTYVLGGGFRPTKRTRVGFEWEHSMNELVGQRFRALCTFDLTVL